MADGKVIIEIAGDINDFKQSVSSIDGIASTGIKALTAAVTAASGALVLFGTQAAQLEATEAKYNTVFEGMTDEVDAFIEEFQQLTPATTTEARSFASNIQDLLIPMGFARDTATEMTEETLHLIGALTNFNSSTHTASQVSGAFAAALTGEREQLKSLGIQISETALQQYILEKGYASSKNEITTQIKAQATLEMALAQSGDALAAYTEENLDTVTNTKILGATFQDVAADVGKSILPAVNELSKALVETLDDPKTQRGLESLSVGLGELSSTISELVINVLPFFIDSLSWLINNLPIISSIITTVVVSLIAMKASMAVAGLVTQLSTAFSLLTGALSITAINANVASGAFVKLTAAILANPIGALAAGITALTAGIVTWISVMGQGSDELKEAKKQTEDTTNAINELTEITQTSLQTTDKNAIVAEKLVSRLQELEHQGDKTTASQAEYKNIVQQLNELMPELNLVIDENTGYLTENLSAIQNQVGALVEQQKVAIYTEDLTEKTKELAQAEYDLEQATFVYNKQLTELEQKEARIAEISAELDRVMSDNTLTTEQLYDKVSLLVSEQQSLTNGIHFEREALAQAKSVMDEYGLSVQSAQVAVSNSSSALNQYNQMLSESQRLEQQLTAEAESYGARYDTLKAKIESLKEAYDAQYQAAYESIWKTVGTFDILEVEVTKSVEDIDAALQSQIDFMANYGANFESVMQRAGSSMPDYFVSKLMDSSTESAAILATLATATDDELNTIVSKMQGVDVGTEAFSTTIAESATDFGNQMQIMEDEYIELTKEFNQYKESSSAADETIQGVIDSVEAKKEDVFDAYFDLGTRGIDALTSQTGQYSVQGEFAGQGYVTGVQSKYASAYWAGYNLAKQGIQGAADAQKTGSPAKEYIQQGEWGGEGYEIGLKDKQKEVNQTAQEMVKSALSEFEVMQSVRVGLDSGIVDLQNNAKNTALNANSIQERPIIVQLQAMLDGVSIGELITPYVDQNLANNQYNALRGGFV